MNPALLAAAAETASLCQENPDQCLGTFRRSLDARLRLAGQPLPPSRRGKIEFIREGVNLDIPLEDLERQIQAYSDRWRSGDPQSHLPALNLLFWGPPGTGKSFLARHLVEQIGRPLIVKRSSDLLGPYVGMTEARIAEAFSEARSQEAVLVIDEIDSLIYRRNADLRSWEVNQVSEFLVQLEQERGMLIWTTNRPESIDPAAKRRIIKIVKFQYLDADSLIQVYRSTFKGMAPDNLTETQEISLKSIRQGTVEGLVSVLNHLTILPVEIRGHDQKIHAVEKEFTRRANDNSVNREHIGFRCQ